MPLAFSNFGQDDLFGDGIGMEALCGMQAPAITFHIDNARIPC